GLWDTLQASMENGGLQLRRLDLPIVHEMLGQTLAASDEYLAANPDVLIGVARGIARATVFGLANPEAAVRIHWRLYPASKPQSATTSGSSRTRSTSSTRASSCSAWTLARTGASASPASPSGRS